MRLLAISEHYFPRLGGTVNYVHETLSGLAGLGVEAELLVPGPLPSGAVPATARYRVTPLDAGYPAAGDPPRAQRQAFCRLADEAVRARVASDDPARRPHLVHVLFGLFVMEVLDAEACRAHGVPTVATVHNLPPAECGRLMPGAGAAARLRERVRLGLVAWKNASRLRRHHHDLLVVPSPAVASLLGPVVPGARIAAIGHGPTTELAALLQPPPSRRPASGAALRVLTVGGFVPHKRQHLIPAVVETLRAEGHPVEWDVAGPPGRVRGYFDAISAEVARRRLAGLVRLHASAPFPELADLYDRAHLYVQPSLEEGFCITALDAAAAGLPVIASPAGALPQIAELSGGRVVASEVPALAEAIGGFARAEAWPRDALAAGAAVRERFSWHAAAEALLGHYRRLLAPGSPARHA